MNLCDEGWRQIYTHMAENYANHMNTPNVKNLKDMFEKYLGVDPSNLDSVRFMDQLDSIITFRGGIVHQVKANKYVHIEDVINYLKVINEIVIGIDMLIREHIKETYKVKVPWNDTYIRIA